MERCYQVCGVDEEEGLGYDGGSVGDFDGVDGCAGAVGRRSVLMVELWWSVYAGLKLIFCLHEHSRELWCHGHVTWKQGMIGTYVKSWSTDVLCKIFELLD